MDPTHRRPTAAVRITWQIHNRLLARKPSLENPYFKPAPAGLVPTATKFQHSHVLCVLHELIGRRRSTPPLHVGGRIQKRVTQRDPMEHASCTHNWPIRPVGPRHPPGVWYAQSRFGGALPSYAMKLLCWIAWCLPVPLGITAVPSRRMPHPAMRRWNVCSCAWGGGVGGGSGRGDGGVGEGWEGLLPGVGGGGCRAPPNSWVCGPGVIRRFKTPLAPVKGWVSSATPLRQLRQLLPSSRRTMRRRLETRSHNRRPCAANSMRPLGAISRTRGRP